MMRTGWWLLPLVAACKDGATETDDGTDTDPADTDSDTDSDTDPTGEACLSEDVAAALSAHLLHVDSVMGLVVGHAGASEAIGILEVPGSEGPVDYFSLFMVCAEPTVYAPYCDSAICSQIECTGNGAAWIVHMSLDGSATSGEFSFDAASADIAWEDGTEVLSWTSSSTATGPGGLDWSSSGTGSVAPDGETWMWSLSETLPGLVDGGATLEVTHPGSGTVVASGVTIATIGETLDVVPTGDCP
jgi:hypothetical protein